jgi:hypothetical protein
MTTTTAGPIPAKADILFERHAWKVFLGVIVLIGFFGISDMFGGASDLEYGEKVYMTGVTGMTWGELQSTSPTVARLIDTIFRANGASLLTVALLSFAICLSGFRKGEGWAWYALWGLPLWMLLTVFFVSTVEKQPGSGTPVPVISGSILFVISASILLLSGPRFFRKNPATTPEKPPNP